MATWVEDIILALQNLGGQATRKELFAEIGRIRTGSLPKSCQAVIQSVLQAHSSDSSGFRGKDYFKKIDSGVWALREAGNQPAAARQYQKKKTKPLQDYASPSFDEISNIFKTIKQYRDFANPNNLDAWFEYVYEIFHIFGFATKPIAPCLIALHDMDSDKDIKALVCLVKPNKDFHYIVPGFDNQSYLFFASKHYHVTWAILTDGLKLKVYNFSSDPDNQENIEYEFDEILKHERTDSFFSIYRLLTLIK